MAQGCVYTRLPSPHHLWSSLLPSIIPVTLCSSHTCLLTKSPMYQAHPPLTLEASILALLSALDTPYHLEPTHLFRPQH